MSQRRVWTTLMAFACAAGTLAWLTPEAPGAVPRASAAPSLITVTTTADSGPGSLRQAIADAAPGETINFSVSYPNTITLSSVLVVNKDITISGPGPANLAVSGGNANAVFSLSGNIAISGLTIRDGNTLGDGGGVGATFSSITITNSSIISNTAVNGGGISLGNSVAVIADSSIQGNTSTNQGGGVLFTNYSTGALTMTNVSIIGNSAPNGGGLYLNQVQPTTLGNVTLTGNQATSGNGGAIHTIGPLVANTLYVYSNTASNSGGGLYNRSFMTISTATLGWNSAPYGGGGIHNTTGSSLSISAFEVYSNTSNSSSGGGIMNEGALTATIGIVRDNVGGAGGGGIYTWQSFYADRVTISGNKVVSSNSVGGAGIMQATGTMTLTNVTISGNTSTATAGTSTSLGGGIYTDGAAYLNNVTIVGNRAEAALSAHGHGGGILPYSGAINFKNTLIAANSASGSGPDCSLYFGGTLFSQGYSLMGTDADCIFAHATGDQIGTASTPIDPKVAPLANYNSPLKTHGLFVGSPAIDHGNPSSPGTGGDACLAKDERGVTRPADAYCDVGAFEGKLFPLFLPLIVK
jgi:polymorphic membrane protein